MSSSRCTEVVGDSLFNRQRLSRATIYLGTHREHDGRHEHPADLPEDAGSEADHEVEVVGEPAHAVHPHDADQLEHGDHHDAQTAECVHQVQHVRPRLQGSEGEVTAVRGPRPPNVSIRCSTYGPACRGQRGEVTAVRGPPNVSIRCSTYGPACRSQRGEVTAVRGPPNVSIRCSTYGPACRSQRREVTAVRGPDRRMCPSGAARTAPPAGVRGERSLL